MLQKTMLLLMLFITVIAAIIFGMPEYPYLERVTEEEIPMPDVQYKLPKVLIGDFVMVSPDCDYYITIFPNNKYILLYHHAGHNPHEAYGYIVKENNSWYFTPTPPGSYRYHFHRLKEIHVTDYGFFFYHDDDSPEWSLHSMRKENIPMPEHLASDITVTRRKSTQQYIVLGSEMIDFNETHNFRSRYHDITIDNGFVYIYRFIDDYMPVLFFYGFVERISESEDILNGIIKFTNGVAYYYVCDGIANIEINSNGSIMVTMLYSPQPEYISRYIKEIPGLQFPARLVLEF